MAVPGNLHRVDLLFVQPCPFERLAVTHRRHLRRTADVQRRRRFEVVEFVRFAGPAEVACGRVDQAAVDQLVVDGTENPREFAGVIFARGADFIAGSARVKAFTTARLQSRRDVILGRASPHYRRSARVNPVTQPSDRPQRGLRHFDGFRADGRASRFVPQFGSGESALQHQGRFEVRRDFVEVRLRPHGREPIFRRHSGHTPSFRFQVSLRHCLRSCFERS